jgi:hypothetical protein
MSEFYTGQTAVRSSGSYFSRHWRGELSLAQSYWLNGVLVGFVFRALFIAGVALLGAFVKDHSLLVPSFILLTLVPVAVCIWQVVGIWRSADNYSEGGGRSMWANLAKIGCVIGVLFMISATRGNLRVAAEIASNENLTLDPVARSY